MATILIRPKTSFRRGLGAASFRNPYWGGMPPALPLGGVATAPSSTNTSSATSTNTGTANGYSGRGRRGWANANQGYAGGSPSNIPPWQQGSQSSSQTASQSTMAAFNAALANAVAYGVISTQGAAQLQSQTSNATDATVQALTAQINQLLATTPSAALTAAGATTTPASTAVTPSTSWWSGSTTLFGSTISNSTLAIGASLAAVALWAAFKKK
jgi:hypothetical protein